MRVVLSLGSNLGDRREHLRAGLDVLHSRLGDLAVSAGYETAPVGVTDQPAFLNVVAVGEVATPAEALAAARAAEQSRHRVREWRWGPRTLDVDVVTAGDVRSDDPDLTLPHPRAHERAFVLVPWLELDAGATLPGRGRVADLVATLPADDVAGVRRTGDLEEGA